MLTFIREWAIKRRKSKYFLNQLTDAELGQVVIDLKREQEVKQQRREAALRKIDEYDD